MTTEIARMNLTARDIAFLGLGLSRLILSIEKGTFENPLDMPVDGVHAICSELADRLKAILIGSLSQEDIEEMNQMMAEHGEKVRAMYKSHKGEA